VGVGVNVAVAVGVGVNVAVAVAVAVGVKVAVGVEVGVGVGMSQSTKEAPSNMLKPVGLSNTVVAYIPDWCSTRTILWSLSRVTRRLSAKFMKSAGR
jgi:hypothetical protein